MTFEGVFQITDWQETTIKEFELGGKLTMASVKQDYQGDILGHSEVCYQMSYQVDGDALFVGFEAVEAIIDGQANRLILKHDGRFEKGIANSSFKVIESTPNKSFSGLTGYFSSIEGGKANYVITAN